ncbi:hypothetical protein NQ314_018647 [Rhamnusium bicolor]|uniref:Uncharacterized protein n=1 Tax=Rhamnusium bicolor TaxID=1586634 RepID=A0AAV8WRF3_9CUCU|nr:hypothetical protein NQ314_018647 [Rhamnusium bicolor]
MDADEYNQDIGNRDQEESEADEVEENIRNTQAQTQAKKLITAITSYLTKNVIGILMGQTIHKRQAHTLWLQGLVCKRQKRLSHKLYGIPRK